MAKDTKTKQQLLSENERLRSRLAECEDTLEAIHTGAVDAFVISDAEGEKIFSLQSVDYSYRVMAENMNEGAVTLDKNGIVVFANKAFADLSGSDLAAAVGRPFREFLTGPLQDGFSDFFNECLLRPRRDEFIFTRTNGDTAPVSISGTAYAIDQTTQNVCLIIGDLSERKTAEAKLQAAYEEVERKVIERTAELQESEARFRNIAESLPVLISLSTSDDSKIVFTNTVYNEAFGFDKEEIIGRPGPDVYYDPADRAKMLEIIKEKGFVRNYQLKAKKRDGTPIWLLSFVQRIIYEGKPAILGASINIADQKAAEEERARLLKEIEKRAAELDATISSLATGLIVYDESGKATYINSVAKELLPQEVFFNTTVEERARVIRWETEDGKPFPPEQIPVARALHGATTHNVVIAAAFPDHKLWISASAAPIRTPEGRMMGVVASFVDITERKKAEEALRSSEEKYRKLIKYAPAAIYEMSLDGTKFFSVNEVLCTIVGYAADELMAIKPIELLDNESKSRFKERIREKLNGNEIEETIEYRVKRKDGKWILVSVNVGAINYSSEKPDRVVVIGYDITERRRMEEALRVSEEKFYKAFKNSPNAITITRLHDGKIIEGNDSVYTLLGYSHEEVVGKTTFELEIWADPAERQKLSQALGSQGYVKNREFSLKRKDGMPVIVDLSASLITIDNQQCFLCSFVDITDRKKAEEELREANAELADFNRAMVGRELRMIELKKEINDFCVQAGLQPRYDLDSEENK